MMVARDGGDLLHIAPHLQRLSELARRRLANDREIAVGCERPERDASVRRDRGDELLNIRGDRGADRLRHFRVALIVELGGDNESRALAADIEIGAVGAGRSRVEHIGALGAGQLDDRGIVVGRPDAS